jgi:hypothetical protein
MTRGVAVGNGPVVAVACGGGAGITAVGIGTGVAVGIAASIGGAAVGSGVAVGGGMGVELGTGIAASVGNGVGMGVIVGEIATGTAGAGLGNSSTCTGPVDARRAVPMASTSACGSLPRSGATPVTA